MATYTCARKSDLLVYIPAYDAGCLCLLMLELQSYQFGQSQHLEGECILLHVAFVCYIASIVVVRSLFLRICQLKIIEKAHDIVE